MRLSNTKEEVNETMREFEESYKLYKKTSYKGEEN